MAKLTNIAAFWGGGRLTYLQHLSLAAYRDAGHEVAVYSYAPIENLPVWVKPRNARDVLPVSRAKALSDLSLITSAFQYQLLAQVPGVVSASLDMCISAPLKPEEGYLLGWQSEAHLGGDLLALPPDSPALKALLDLTAGAHDPTMRWGSWGADALTREATKSGEAEHAADRAVFYPYSFADRRQMIVRRMQLSALGTEKTRAYPLYGGGLARLLQRDQDGVPKYWSPLGALLRQHEVPVLSAPLRVGGEPGRDRWKDEVAPLPVHPVSAHPAASQGKVAASLPGRAAAQKKQPAAPLPRKPVSSAKTSAQRREPPKVMIVTTMKNEAPFILEWVAYHRAIGITDFIVYTNDCDDGTVELLDTLVEKGLISARIDNPFGTSKANDWQRAALWDAQAREDVKGMDWVIPMDVDEFINIHVGDGSFSALLDALPDARMISMVWRLFGNGFEERFDDSFVTRNLTWAARENTPRPSLARGFKTAFRPGDHPTKWSVHRPKALSSTSPAELGWFMGSGALMPEKVVKGGWRVDLNKVGYDLVSLNHYSLRNCESYLVKRQRGRVNHVDEDQGLAYWFRMNHNVEREMSIADKLPGMEAAFAKMMADPDIAARHKAGVAAHRARIDELKEAQSYRQLFDIVRSHRLNVYSRLANHFGNWIFAVGPQAIPEEYERWAMQMNEVGEMPDGAGPPPGMQSSGTILPRPEYAEEINEARRKNNVNAEPLSDEQLSGTGST